MLTDTVSKKKRSEIMSKIKSKRTRPELALSEIKKIKVVLPGEHTHFTFQPQVRTPEKTVKPDWGASWFHPEGECAGIAVFVDGCFFHGCPKHYKPPKSHVAFWKAKIRRNMERDQVDNHVFSDAGWVVVRVWEHLLRKDADVIMVLDRIKRISSNPGLHRGEVIVWT